MTPPFKLTPKILKQVSEISLLLGKIEGLNLPRPQPQLRRSNRIKTIQGRLAIEGNTLSLEQVSAVLDHKKVLGPKKDILEVQNAIQAYESLSLLSPNSEKDLLRAHSLLMKGLIDHPGKYRLGGVGILKGSKVSHVAPPAKQVPRLMAELLTFLKKENEYSSLIKACVFHYEFEFIHPFMDGNGRMGRLWQTLILMKDHPVFEFLPVESLIKERSGGYYEALEKSDKAGESTLFIEFLLGAIRDALEEFEIEVRPGPQTSEVRLQIAHEKFGKNPFRRKAYLELFKTVSTATASRDMAKGVAQKILKKTGDRATAVYIFVNP